MGRKGKLPLSRSAEEVEESSLKQGHEAARQRLQWGPARSRWQQVAAGEPGAHAGRGGRLRRGHRHPRGIQQQQPGSFCLPAKGRKGKKKIKKAPQNLEIAPCNVKLEALNY